MKKLLIENKVVTGLHSGITGDLSGIRGDLSGISGNIDECELTDSEREKGVNISELIAESE